MNLKLTTAMLVMVIAITSNTNGQCNCQTFDKDSNVVKQCPPTPVAGDNSLQIGIGLGEINNHTDYLSITIRFRYSAQKVQGNLTLVLANGRIVTLKMLNSGLAYLGNNEVCQATYLLSNTATALLKASSIKYVRFNLEDDFRHELPVQMNSRIIISQLNCL